ncbi:alpha/beta hydrolase [Terrabacter aerolatus]|uniref:Lysophospholipase n=1 Tax=Terrabacter aerolatus TaxID=422442 RepID=A0A512D6X3_9MICO|nr:alpha/beta hydrolase [Terrabacter aerolatus]GEO32229.1 lysophospholipase [Terrabacter aerolatus]
MRAHLVLVHGSRLSSSQWAPQVPLLRGHVDLTLVDLPGHGVRVDEEFTLARCVEVIGDAVAAVPSGSPVVVVGHSLGGYAAMAYAAARPATLGGLVLAGSSAVPTGPGAAVYRGVAVLTDRIGPARMTRVNDRVLHRLYPAGRIDPVIAGGYYFAPTAAAWREVMAHCRPSMLEQVRCPVLLLNGRFDQLRIGARAYLRVCPSAREQIVPGAGHLSNLDRPEAFAAALLRFAHLVVDSAPRD